MKFAAALLVATISAEQLFAAEANLAATTAPECKLTASPRCEVVDGAKFVCMASSTGKFVTVEAQPADVKDISLDFTPVVSVCQPVSKDDETKGAPVDYKLTMKVGGKAIATGTYAATSFTLVTGAQALVASAVAALSTVYIM